MHHVGAPHDAGAGLLLRWPLQAQERRQHDDDGLWRHRRRRRHLGFVRMVLCLWRRRRPAVLRRHRPNRLLQRRDGHVRRGKRQQRGARLSLHREHRLPARLRHDHDGHHHGCRRRPHEVRRPHPVRGPLGTARLCTAGPHGLGRRRKPHRRHDRCPRLRRWRRRAHQLRSHRSHALPHHRTSQGLRPHELSSA